ncbi:uncharacterized protein PGTG_13635 [Puccinia graminis f. sp. tritici CRL 75-36-700-3]|uniref:Uncharacterized protein n=1 Tax=Puccinia graminis f. sp. tritici (strain CRL 75-36-700-3 / race SCCL) TaxID=418459 RepID=E3KT21_PUCGT|nr:uncharacterized protein PGTG_13635 [Puccinia graminis f. sp. tritici CRL 75-36-700-3]EFP87407.2 hypothetical protein PGTG_13635 [Puccinia graminis f. sp. tritici CRL 75-36-700-3]
MAGQKVIDGPKNWHPAPPGGCEAGAGSTPQAVLVPRKGYRRTISKKTDVSQAPTRKKGRLSDPSADYHCKSESQDLDMQAQNARHEFNLGRFKVALKAFRCIYQTICHNSSHDSPRRHSFFLHIRLDVSQCHLALLQGPEALKVLSPCYQWGHQTSISWSNPLWSEVSSLIASSQMLIRQEEQIKTMLENQQWKEVNEGISEVVSATEYMSQYLSCTK